jgi:hypothetical protein
MAKPYQPVPLPDDEDLRYWIGELLDYAERRANVGQYPNDDTVIVCRVCDDVDGHLDGCPITVLKKVARLTAEEDKRSAERKAKAANSGKGW